MGMKVTPLKNHEYAVALHYIHDNFIRKHQSIGATPALQARIVNKAWTMVGFVRMMEEEERRIGGRITNYKPAPSNKD